MNKSKLIVIVFCLALIAGACKPKDEDSDQKMKELADQFFLLKDTVWIDDAIFISPISTFNDRSYCVLSARPIAYTVHHIITLSSPT